MKTWTLCGALALAFGVIVGVAAASTPGADVRLTHDANDPGYVSSYTLATGTLYTDATLSECTRSRGRQNEPAGRPEEHERDPRECQRLLRRVQRE